MGDLIGLGLSALFFAACAVVAIAFLRKSHSGEVYLIWYVVSFFFVLFAGLDAIALRNNVTTTAICGSYEPTCKWVYGLFTDFDGEVELLIAIVALAIVPQILAYILSGFSGSASAPKFVSAITTYALWSLIKFGAAFAGILLAEALTKLYFHKPVTPRDFALVIFFIAVAFGLSLYATFDFASLPAHVRAEILNRFGFIIRARDGIHSRCTRNVIEE